MNTKPCTTSLSTAFKVGTRSSKLALIQTQNALDLLQADFPNSDFQRIDQKSPGDRDLKTDLRQSPADFFTRDLDEAVLNGELDAAIHSAKDMPYPVTDGLDWFWLPWKEDPRDAIILRPGETLDDLPKNFIAGVSSDRREEYLREFFPDSISKPIRGDIGQRLAQLDAGDFDMIIMAGCALKRLNQAERISQWIPLSEMPVPEAQGTLSVTFRKNDPRWQKIRTLYTKAVTFAGAGIGTADNSTLATIKAIKNCDICLYDALMDDRLLANLSPQAQPIFVGKRSGKHYMRQVKISELVDDYTRKGYKVVRLKGGDASVFGRLAEEVETLDELSLPYRVIPGVTASSVSSAETGILSTRRGINRGFTVMTPREACGKIVDIQEQIEKYQPIYLYMSIATLRPAAAQLVEGGRSSDSPAAVVFGAGSNDQIVVRGTLADIADKVDQIETSLPGLVIIGEIAAYKFQESGPLGGRKVLLTCSAQIQEKASIFTQDFGGRPIQFPLIELKANSAGAKEVTNVKNYDWIVITSPSSVRCFMEQVEQQSVDLRSIPKIMTCGKGSADELKKYGIHADASPEFDFSAKALIETAGKVLKPNEKVLRLRAQKAGEKLAESLKELAVEVTDCVLYDNSPINYDVLPKFDDVFFASASAVESFVAQWGVEALKDKTIVVIGLPTRDALEKIGIDNAIVSKIATVEGSINTLAKFHLNKE